MILQIVHALFLQSQIHWIKKPIPQRAKKMADMCITASNVGVTITEKLSLEYTGEKPIAGVSAGRGYPVVGFVTDKKHNDQGEYISIQFLIIDDSGKLKYIYPSACRLACSFYGR